MGDLRFDLNNIDSYELIAKHIKKTDFLEWTGLRHSVPLDLRIAYHNPDHTPNANMADRSVVARNESHGSEVSEALMFCSFSFP